LNTQQINNLIAYLRSIQIPREGCLEGEDPLTCDVGTLPAEIQENIEALARQSVEDGEYDSYGEALFNLDLASGAYSCARCHTIGWSYDQPGEPGQGAFGWNLTGGAVNRHFANQDQLISFIRRGSENGKLYGLNGQGSGRMPGFGSMLTEEQITAVVEYIETL
jgi:mono/diheme cytochrome c family protein